MVNRLISDIRKSLDHECYYSALSLALTLPDICGITELPTTQVVAERYINWCDLYICNVEDEKFRVDNNVKTPYLSGEVIYNLRNTYLHQGCPNVIKSKVKNEINQMDNFVLILGKAKKIFEISMHIEVGDGLANSRHYFIDVTYLCNLICDVAEHYYSLNKEKFHMDYKVIDENELLDMTMGAR